MRKLVPAGITMVAATYGLARYAYGLFLPDIQMDLGLSTSFMGVVAGVSYAGFLAATLVGTWLSNHFGPRLPIVAGGLFAAAGMTLISMATNSWVLATGVFLAGCSPGLAYPPFSDTVMNLIKKKDRNRAYAWINSGTGFGVLLAGPLAIWAGADWRSAWFAFAVVAFVAALWNARQLPGGLLTRQKSNHHNYFKIITENKCGLMFISALLFGIATSVYWTFAVDLITTTGLVKTSDSAVFWVFIGLAGIIGCQAGDFISRFGLQNVFTASLSAISFAMVSLAMAPDNFWIVSLSGALFGSSFIIATAAFGIWSIYLFQKTPSVGFGLTFFLISLGQLTGPVAASYATEFLDMPTNFYIAGLLCMLLLAFSPEKVIRSMNEKM